MAFGYLKDPLFVACFCTYWLHRVLANYGLSTPLLQAYLNDFICIGFWIPMVLWVQRRLGLRPNDGQPQPYEIVIPVVIWAVVFELVLPATRGWSGLAVADPIDVLCYAVGGLVATCIWTWRYGTVVEGRSSGA